MKDFTALDNAILTRIAEGPCTFVSIGTRVNHLAMSLAVKKDESFRVVDRRLQALRKRGLIQYHRARWFLRAPDTDKP